MTLSSVAQSGRSRHRFLLRAAFPALSQTSQPRALPLLLDDSLRAGFRFNIRRYGGDNCQPERYLTIRHSRHIKYIESVHNRNSRPAILLRESFREGKRVRKRTIANLTDWPAAKIEALRAVLHRRISGMHGPAPPALIGCPGTRCHLPRSLLLAIIPVAPLTRTRI